MKSNLAEGDDETHDFAMAILDREIEFTDSVRPICIPKQVPLGDWTEEEKNDLQGMDFGGKKAIAAGWGR